MLPDVVFSVVVKSQNVSNMFGFLSKPIWLRPRIGLATHVQMIIDICRSDLYDRVQSAWTSQK